MYLLPLFSARLLAKKMIIMSFEDAEQYLYEGELLKYL
jgi:hypothetical protein